MLDVFNSSAFNMVSMTDAINLFPNRYGRAGSLGLFPIRGVNTRHVAIEMKNGVLNLLPTQPLGAPGTLGTPAKRIIRSFAIPHIPHDDAVPPEEVQGIRAFGTESGFESVVQKVNEKLEVMRMKHAITLEHLRMGALKGIILDADGSTLYNLFTEFNIVQKIINIDFSDTGTKVLLKILEMKNYIEENLLGEVMTDIRVLCGSTFFAAFTTHASVEAAFSQFQTRQTLDGDYRTGFVFGGITFEQYLGKASDAAGTVRKFVEDDEAIAFPMGTVDSHATYVAPADFNETVNTIGRELYAKQETRKFDRGIDIHTQSNPLPIWKRPALLVKLTMDVET
jgi:hypothetical protein